MNRPTLFGRVVRGALLGALGVTAVGITGSGCLDRPVAPATPNVSARVVEYAKQNKVNKIDLLFMIDNSSSMADKQSILSAAVPELVDRLIEPKCVDPTTGATVGSAVGGVCAKGELDFEPIKDIHIGIISSSLGPHGAGPNICDDTYDNMTQRSDPHNNDRGHLISRSAMAGTTVPTYQSKGFLYYNPSAMGALATAQQVATPFSSMVGGVGQHGCGYEASLEAIYRFLIDPEPYDTIRIDTSIGGYGQAKLYDIDTQLIAQRKEFLRPDSLVSIMIVTDENDCSIQDTDQGFYALLPPISGTGRSVLSHGTSKCLENPNDKCCFNCGVANAPAGCAPPDSDPECMKGQLTVAEDPQNLRCFNQKKKYGQEFLYPVQRYIDGFTKNKVPNRKGEMVDNPLYADLTCTSTAGCGAQREKSLVFVAGIVGVPWQDIAVNPMDLTLGYKTAKEIADQGIWNDIVGDPANAGGPIPPKDPHMIESITPRMNIPGPGSAATADPINGHEWDPSKDTVQPSADLQYACIFPLNPTKTCDPGASDCDCGSANVADMKSPLCQNPTSGAYSNVQARAKAYPGTRILQVLKGLDASQAIVASVCPANVTDKTRDDFGYSPAIHSLVSRLRNALRGRCLPRTLEVKQAPGAPDDGNVPCVVVEAFTQPNCDCASAPGRLVIPNNSDIVTDEMKKATNASCFCEIQQLTGDPQHICKTNLNPPTNTGNGWCYVDPQQGANGMFDPDQCPIVRSCAATEKRLIKFINTASEPRAGATAFIMCQEKSFPSNGSASTSNDMCGK